MATPHKKVESYCCKITKIGFPHFINLLWKCPCKNQHRNLKRCLENRHKYTSRTFRSDDLQNILSNKLYISFLSRTLLWDTYRCISDSLGSFYTHKALCFEMHLELSTVISSLTDFGKIPISVSSTNLGTKSTNRLHRVP